MAGILDEMLPHPVDLSFFPIRNLLRIVLNYLVIFICLRIRQVFSFTTGLLRSDALHDLPDYIINYAPIQSELAVGEILTVDHNRGVLHFYPFPESFKLKEQPLPELLYGKHAPVGKFHIA
ncbi:hypothetical protein DMB44_03185 [Thermoplasma sp. Kam2015]|nr:hypothetical protein DMB44_03185 [Thermoplasma sp. Kam2015]